MRRRFNNSERAALFLAADGKCCECGDELGPGWHADHVTPYSANGPTDLINGQALCPSCNLKKGNRMMTISYNDAFDPRPFQVDLEHTVVRNISQGVKATVGHVGVGSGKTLGYQATANRLLREGLIDTVAVYAPRTSLASQCELDYINEGVHLFDKSLRFEKFLHNVNTPPFTPESLCGFVSTYSALTTRPELHLKWARENVGRFLLVVDEAQFCGLEDDESRSGTASANMIKSISAFATHTLILTGTANRSDGAKIVLADYYTGADGKEYLDHHVKANYSDGIAQKYLRQFESRMVNASVTRRNTVTDEDEVTELSEDCRQLGQVLKTPGVWHQLVDTTISELKDAQALWPRYKGLIACMKQDDVTAVEHYIRAHHPGVSYRKAISDEAKVARDALRRFREEDDDTDLLLTVRMAFVGYSCNRITVIGCLTNYRDYGHLEQLIGRGLRVDKASGIDPEDQRCRIVAPDDRLMTGFLNHLREQQEIGISQRTGRDGPPPPDSTTVVEDAKATTIRVMGLMSDIDSAELERIDALKSSYHLAGSATDFAKMLKDLNLDLRKAPAEAHRPARSQRVVKTERERVQELATEAYQLIQDAAANDGILYFRDGVKNPDFSKQLGRFTAKVHKRYGIKNRDDIVTAAQAEDFRNFCLKLVEQSTS